MSTFNFIERIVEEVLDEFLRKENSLSLEPNSRQSIKTAVVTYIRANHSHLSNPSASCRVQGVDLQLKADILLEISRQLKSMGK